MSKGIKAGAVVVALLLALGVPGGSQGQPQSQPMSFGVIVWRSPTLTAQFWNPILRWVSDRSGVPLQLKVAPTGPEHTAMVRRGDLQFLYSNHNFIKENERPFGSAKREIRRDRGSPSWPSPPSPCAAIGNGVSRPAWTTI